jgi:hypothetical protein
MLLTEKGGRGWCLAPFYRQYPSWVPVLNKRFDSGDESLRTAKPHRLDDLPGEAVLSSPLLLPPIYGNKIFTCERGTEMLFISLGITVYVLNIVKS